MRDAVQDACIALWLKHQTIPTPKKEARKEVFAIVAAVARERYRDAQKKLALEQHVDAPNPQNDEEWIARRLLLLEALEKLDDHSRDLIIARVLEAKTYETIGAELNEKPDTVRKRFDIAREKLKREILRLLGDDNTPTGSSEAFWALMFDFTPFDRALLRAFLEAEQPISTAASTHNARHVTATKGGLLSGVPMSVLLGTLVMLPAEMPNKPSVRAAKISDVPLPNLVIGMDAPVPTPPGPTATASTPAPSIHAPLIPHSARPTTLDDATKASFRGVVSKSGSPP
jgi:RNA polymerase sigma factor (sigma-70 family)